MVRNSNSQASPLNAKDGWIAAGLWLLSLAVYVRTLVPGLIPNDSAEFQTLAYTLGHAHTTGYEVYVLLARLFVFLPVGEVAYRVNLFSAFLGALTIAFVYLSGRVVSGSRWAGGLAALVLAISATFWSQAIIAEVYMAGAAFASAILLLVLLWDATGRGRYLLGAGLLGGLALGVHATNGLFAPAILLLLFWRCPNPRTWWKPALGGAVLGLLLMLAAFALVDAVNPPSSSINAIYGPSVTRWDLAPDALDSFAGRLQYLVLARQWRSAMFVRPEEVIPQNFGIFSKTLDQDFHPLVPLLALVGWLMLLVRRPRLAVFFGLALLAHGMYTLNYRIGDIYVFFISFYVYASVLVAEGTAWVLKWVQRVPRLNNNGVRAVLAAGLILLVLLPFVPKAFQFVQAGEARWDFMGLESNKKLADWHKIVSYNVQSLPQDAIVLMDWGNLYGYFYAAQVEQGRSDLQFIETYPYANKDGMADSLLVYLQKNVAAGRPLLAIQKYDELQRGGFVLRMKSVGLSTFYTVTESK